MKKIFLIIATFVVIAFFTSDFWLAAFGRYLVVDEKPRRCDAIVILSGETVPRVAKGVELYKEGYGGIIILSGGGKITSRLTDADVMLMEALEQGVPPSSVLLENKAESTYENALFVKEIILDYDIKSFILVTSNYHTRRARYIFKKVFNGTGVHFITVAAPDRKYSAGSWWKKHEGQQKALTELANLIIYRLKY